MLNVRNTNSVAKTLLLMFFISFFFNNTRAEEKMAFELLIAGVKHYDYKVKTAKGNLNWRYTVSEYSKKLHPLRKNETFGEGLWEISFAFDKYKIRCDIYYPQLFPDYTKVYDRKKQMEVGIDNTLKPKAIQVRDRFSIQYENFPRFWETHNKCAFEGIYLGEYLEKLRNKGKLELLGKEKIRDVMCYKIKAKDGNKKEFWIAKEGFRLMKSVTWSASGGAPIKFIQRTDYIELEGGIWFPKSGTREVLRWDKESRKFRILNRYVMKLKDVKVNVDVSDRFKLDIPPKTKVWDHRAELMRKWDEIGWHN